MIAEVKSYKTAISRSGPSAPLRFVESNFKSSDLILDYGCGKGADTEYLRGKGYYVDSYDPYYSNIDLSDKDSFYDVIICNYVLNVLEIDQEASLISDIKSKLKPGGRAYVSVRRDSFSEGHSSRGYQRVVNLNGYPSYEKKGCYEIYFVSK